MKRTLQKARAAKRVTYLEISRYTSMTQATLCRIEKGQTIGSQNNRREIEAALGEEINWLETEKVIVDGMLSNWIECEMLFRLLVRKINGLGNPDEFPHQKERAEFLTTAVRYLRRMRKGE